MQAVKKKIQDVSTTRKAKAEAKAQEKVCSAHAHTYID